MIQKFILSFLFALVSIICLGQVYTPGTTDDQILSFLDLKNKRYHSNVYNYSIRYDGDSLKWNPWEMPKKEQDDFYILDPLIGAFYNSTYARGYNDGALWRGNGTTAELHGGIKGKFGKKWHYTFQPVVYFSQNSDFTLAPDSLDRFQNPYTYQLGRGRQVDFVQRFGNGSFVDINFGQSEVRYLGDWFTAAITTQNISYGPVETNPILLSKNAAGIPNLHLGTSRPINIKVKGYDFGSFETHIHYGLLKESDYLDSLSNNDYRYLNGITLGYTPPFLDHFTFGFSKILYKNTRFFETQDLYSIVKIADDGVIEIDGDTLDFANDTFDQLASFFAQYHDLEYGLKIYVEYAKNDFNGVEQTLTEPHHARAFAMGFQKIYENGSDRFFRIHYEHSNLIRSSSSVYRTASPRFYIHNANIHGYTNQGQILGAGTGPGSSTDYLSLDWLNGTGIKSLYVQRIAFDEDYFLLAIRDKTRHDVEYTVGFRQMKVVDNFMFSGQILGSYRFNHYYQKDADKFNLGLNASLRYFLGSN